MRDTHHTVAETAPADSRIEKPRKPFSLAARLQSIGFALNGIKVLVRDEHNARIHLFACVVVSVAGFALRLPLAEWCWIILAVALVLALETINTAVEQLCDRITLEEDPMIRRAKDVAASAVLIASIAAVAIGAATLLPHLQQTAAATICGGKAA
ncbi:diacylglycerol kinase family protein [Sphingomonas sp. 1P06PA]|uniref:diacylglycerol kinase family protein n=1 Tax=Sphingomonas sp. 1P06PA TaxID=554121 RepID=UPI0039A6EF28